MVVADHPELAGDYRTAHAIRRRSDGGEATLDELREGFQHYRALFSRLLDDAAGGDQDGDRRVAPRPKRSATRSEEGASQWDRRAADPQGSEHVATREGDGDVR